MKRKILDYLNHYQLIYLFSTILLGSGFILAIILKLNHQSVWIMFDSIYSSLINMDVLKLYLYFILCLIFLIIFSSFHVFGILIIGVITFLYGVHIGNYIYVIFTQSLGFLKTINELLFILTQTIGIFVILNGAIEISMNVFAITFVFKERLKAIDLLNYYINYVFITLTIVFISIILKIYIP